MLKFSSRALQEDNTWEYSGWLIAANHMPLIRWRISLLEINASSISRANESSHFVVVMIDHDNVFKNLNWIINVELNNK